MQTLIQMYHALFNSHLQYGILCWGSSSMTNIHRLQVLQNRAIRNMMRAPRYFRLDNYYLNLRILKVHDLFNLEIAKFMHSHHNKTLPICFASFFQESGRNHAYNTRSSAQMNYDTILCKTARSQRSIRFYGPKIWNEIPISIKTDSKYTFKKQYKSFVLSSYWSIMIGYHLTQQNLKQQNLIQQNLIQQNLKQQIFNTANI